MATVPLSGTDIRILSGVPFYKDYKHSRWFESLTEQTTYFQSKPVVHQMTSANFQRIEGRRYVSANKSIDELWGANYLMFRNAHYNNKWFYAFVTKLEYVNARMTHVHFQIDVLQTWLRDMQFKPSFVVREHGREWNSDGTPIINTLDEGLNYGTDYDTVAVRKYTPNDGYKWLVIISKTALDGNNDIKASSNGIAQPLTYYLVPFKGTNTPPSRVTYGTAGAYAETSSPISVLTELYQNQSAVNNIVSVYVTEFPGIGAAYENDTITIPSAALGYSLQEMKITDTVSCLKVNYIGTYSSEEITHLTDKYSPYPSVKFSKLLMHPYTLTIIDDFKGNRLEVKNEYISGKELKTLLKGSMGVSQKTSLQVANYNRTTDNHSLTTAQETSIINANPQDVSIITDHLAAFLQGNRNTIENQRASIMWNGAFNAIGGAVGTAAAMKSPGMTGETIAGLGVVQGLGNTVLQLEAINAKQRDIDNTPPALSKMGSNIAYDFGNGYSGYYIIHKMIKPEYRRKLEDFWNMFGYKLHEVKKPYFHSRRYWNYIQTESCTITGNFNNEDLVELKSIFDSGITLWHTDDIGNYDLNNEVII